ncbi:hypothetical protein Taro_004686 [Colocasia esculenta]|uniref:AP2/ERF domain-containing protein n=1 Tax=Colocasia esculenta TaxID=4460 RepID=A0A843TMQ7_COLES|nr:hypothetical protein [Colocasia esculenta]
MGKGGEATVDPAAVAAAARETRFRGVRKRPWGRFTAEIRDLWKKVCLAQHPGDEEDAARAYDAVTRALRSPKTKTNSPPALGAPLPATLSPLGIFPRHHQQRRPQAPPPDQPPRPASSSHSSMVESSVEPRGSVATPQPAPRPRMSAI